MRGPLGQQVLDALGHLVALAEQLGRRELGHDCPEDLIAEGRQDLLLVILAEPGIDEPQLVDLRMEEDPHRELDALHVPIGSLREDLVLPGLRVVDDGVLKEGQFEVVALPVDHGTQRSGNFVELYGVVADIDYFREMLP